jgi:hypothetical protein
MNGGFFGCCWVWSCQIEAEESNSSSDRNSNRMSERE